MGATIGLPVAGGISFDDQELRAFLLTLEGGVQASSLSLPFSAEPRDVFALQGGVAGAHLLGGQTVLVWSAEGGFAEDDRTVRSPKPRLSGSVFVIRPHSRQLTLLYGGLLSFVFTKPLILPMFGVLWHPQALTSVVVFAPLSGSVFRSIGSRLIVGAGVGLMGDRFRIANDKDRFPGVGDTVDLRMHELRIGGNAGVRIARGLVLAVEGGVSVVRHVGLAEKRATDEFYSANISHGPYVSIRIRAALPGWTVWDNPVWTR